MSLSSDTSKKLINAMVGQRAGREVIDAINLGVAGAQQDGWKIPAVITAAHTSTTTDFAALAVGDLVVHIPAVAGNCSFLLTATAGTLAAAAVVGDLYIVLRAFSAPAASAAKL